MVDQITLLETIPGFVTLQEHWYRSTVPRKLIKQKSDIFLNVKRKPTCTQITSLTIFQRNNEARS